MKTAIRLDDITPDMDWDRYNRIEKILNEANIKPLIGVVPYNMDDNLSRAFKKKSDDEFKEYLSEKKSDGWEIALHGYNHTYTTKAMGIFPLNNFSEFAGVAYDKQLKMLENGLKKLDEWGIDTDIFMTPAHTFDKNTLKAMKAAGIKRVTDGFGDVPFIRDGLTFYPICKRRKDAISNMSGYTTYVLHTNTMEDSDIMNFERTVKEHRDCFIDYSDYLQIEAVNRGAFGNIKEYITALSKFVLVKIIAR